MVVVHLAVAVLVAQVEVAIDITTTTGMVVIPIHDLMALHIIHLRVVRLLLDHHHLAHLVDNRMEVIIHDDLIHIRHLILVDLHPHQEDVIHMIDVHRIIAAVIMVLVVALVVVVAVRLHLAPLLLLLVHYLRIHQVMADILHTITDQVVVLDHLWHLIALLLIHHAAAIIIQAHHLRRFLLDLLIHLDHHHVYHHYQVQDITVHHVTYHHHLDHHHNPKYPHRHLHRHLHRPIYHQEAHIDPAPNSYLPHRYHHRLDLRLQLLDNQHNHLLP